MDLNKVIAYNFCREKQMFGLHPPPLVSFRYCTKQDFIVTEFCTIFINLTPAK